MNEYSSRLAGRFRKTFDAWETMFDRVHDPDTTDYRRVGRRISHYVHLFPHTHETYGEGMVSALVFAGNASGVVPDYRTEVYFTNEAAVLTPTYEVVQVPDRQHPELRGWDEDFVSPDPSAFLRPGFEWTSLSHKDSGTAWSNLATFGHVAEKILHRAEETHRLLRQAIGDAALNPHFHEPQA